jgi:hypothetical protein
VQNLVSTLREEHRLRVFENRALKRIFAPKRDEVMGEWRNLKNEELQDLYCLAGTRCYSKFYNFESWPVQFVKHI